MSWQSVSPLLSPSIHKDALEAVPAQVFAEIDDVDVDDANGQPQTAERDSLARNSTTAGIAIYRRPRQQRQQPAKARQSQRKLGFAVCVALLVQD